MPVFREGPSWQKISEPIKKVVNDPLAVIYNEGQWKLSKVSPLYNLRYDAVKLKQYSSKIRQSIVSSVVAASTVRYTVELQVQSHLKYSEDDADGLLITISSTQENNNKTKIAYIALLLSWGQSVSLENATHLPYLIERGEQKLGSAVKSTLRAIFDCTIVHFNFTQQQLLQFGFNFLENDTSRDHEPFTFVYTTPQVEHKDKLKLSFQIEDVKLIWNGVKDEVSIPRDTISFAYQMLQNQVFHMVTLDISVFNLCEVLLPKAEVKNNGTVKMKTPEMVNCVFTLLNEISDFCSTDSDSNSNSYESNETNE